LPNSPTLILKFVLGLTLTLILAACGGESPTNTTSPATPTVPATKSLVAGVATNLAGPITNAPPTLAQSQIQSQGLGLSKTDWEKLHGSGTTLAPGIPSFQYEKGQYQIIMIDDRVTQLQRYWLSQPVSLDMAKEESKKLYPVDAKIIKSVVTSTKDNVDIFFSDIVKQAFASSQNSGLLWPGGAPGNFTVTYRQAVNNQINSLIIALGVNPT